MAKRLSSPATLAPSAQPLPPPHPARPSRLRRAGRPRLFRRRPKKRSNQVLRQDCFRTMNFCGLAKINLRRLAGEPLFTSTDYESISKSFEEDDEASELNKAEEVLGVVLPMDQDAALPLYPGEEALDEPASHIAA